MSEEVIGIARVNRPGLMSVVYEILYFTPDRMVVARESGGKGGILFGAIGGAVEGVLQQREAKKKGEQYSQLSLEDIIKADKNNYAIPNSEITEVELKKAWTGVISLNIKTSKFKKYGYTKWNILEPWKNANEKYENLLRLIFKDRLVIKK